MNSAIVVRRSRPEDAPGIHCIRSHPAVRRFQPLEPRSVEELERILDLRGNASLTPDQAGELQWTVLVGEAIAGWVTVTVTSRRHHTGAIGYSLDPRFHGRGVATQAVREVADILLDPNLLALERLEAVVAADNTASRRVLEKSGFVFEGVARGLLIIADHRVDHARYARLVARGVMN